MLRTRCRTLPRSSLAQTSRRSLQRQPAMNRGAPQVCLQPKAIRCVVGSLADPPADCTAGTLSAEIARFTYGYDDFKAVRPAGRRQTPSSLPTCQADRHCAAALRASGRAHTRTYPRRFRLAHRLLFPHPGDDPHLEEHRAHWRAVVRRLPGRGPSLRRLDAAAIGTSHHTRAHPLQACRLQDAQSARVLVAARLGARHRGRAGPLA